MNSSGQNAPTGAVRAVGPVLATARPAQPIGRPTITLSPDSLDMLDSGSPSDQSLQSRDDAQLMALVAQGDVAAFDAIVARNWRPTFLYVYHLTRDREKAFDVTQEAFAKLWQQRAKWQPSGALGAWLLRVAKNAVITDQRRWRLHMRWTSSTAREEARSPRTPLQDAEVTEMGVAMREAIDGMPQRRREVFILFHLQNLSHREIGEILGIKAQTVANHLHEAAVELRSLMKRFQPDG